MKEYHYPYKHYLQPGFFSSRQLDLLRIFTSSAVWMPYQNEDFPQYIMPKDAVLNFFILNSNTSQVFRYLFSRKFILTLESLFNIILEECCAISFHRLIKGNFNKKHNDFNTLGEKVRIVCYLSAPDAYKGGALNLYSSKCNDIPSISYKLKENTSFIFAMDQMSIHSVGKVCTGERICMVITYK